MYVIEILNSKTLKYYKACYFTFDSGREHAVI